MKYRIKQKGTKYYPQKRILGFYCNFAYGYGDLYFDNFKSAKIFIEVAEEENKTKIHKVEL